MAVPSFMLLAGSTLARILWILSWGPSVLFTWFLDHAWQVANVSFWVNTIVE